MKLLGIFSERINMSLLLAMSLWIGFAQCQAAPNEAAQTAVIAQVDPASPQHDTSIVILDVRTPEEFREGHLPHAILVDYYADDFRAQINKLDKQARYFVYCRTGRRSSDAIRMMRMDGFKQLENMDGGIVQWTGPIVKP